MAHRRISTLVRKASWLPRSRGGTDHLENLQLLCSRCNRIKGDRPLEYLVARLTEIGV